MNKKSKKIVVIGGGTGTFTVLSGLRNYKDLDLSAVITMADSGGSNRVLRDEFGLLPTSDLRQCMVALASPDANETLRRLFTYRFVNGVGISGMTFGNLFMAALTDIYNGDQKKAIKETCQILGVNGKIIPVTYEKSNLVATYENGRQILGENEIDEPVEEQGKYKITKLEIFPQVKANKDAIRALNQADLIILGPGDIYTSVLSNVVVDGVANAIKKSKGKVLYILNVMTKYGQTNGFTATDFVNEVTKYLNGRSPDFVLMNSDREIPRLVLERYKEEKSDMVVDDLDKLDSKTKIIRAKLISKNIYEKSKSDKLFRSLLRHNSARLAKSIYSIVTSR